MTSDTYILHDTKCQTYHDIFGRELSPSDLKCRINAKLKAEAERAKLSSGAIVIPIKNNHPSN